MDYNAKLQQAIHAGAKIQVHLISGETYQGQCLLGDRPGYYSIQTGRGLFSFPSWAIKRLKNL
ncbi:hypothetical protein [Paenibacillus tengchongensis]|uniref:hypothetical protein n=1 Tax=Paenibacillus tengchongensis TaxID=2608684 RepID=UPI00124D765C|nr:hypothetical protein [Paenibacillus tengchongensis]